MVMGCSFRGEEIGHNWEPQPGLARKIRRRLGIPVAQGFSSVVPGGTWRRQGGKGARRFETAGCEVSAKRFARGVVEILVYDGGACFRPWRGFGGIALGNPPLKWWAIVGRP